MPRMRRFPGDDIPIVPDVVRSAAVLHMADIFNLTPVSHAQVSGG